MGIRPQLNVKVVVGTDDRTERIYARDSVIYDISGETLILAQTEPSIESSMLNKEILVTYLEQESGDYLRYGFSAVVVEFIDQYQPMSEQHVCAIAIRKRSDPKPYNIRMSYRVKPSSKSGLDVSIYNKKVTLVDISLGGIRFSCDKSLQLEANKVIELRLGVGGAAYTIEAKVIRAWEANTGGFKKDLWFAVAEFVNVSRRIEQELSRTIRDIERENLIHH